ncbi:MAG: hypothetical protein H0W83_08610 [Planctomycetes bacterium]|nr:hypothetical protein [Planctomycetota bacterium]
MPTTPITGPALSSIAALLGALCLMPGVAAASEAIPVGTWVTTRTEGFAAQAVGYDRLVYAPAPVSKAVILGNYHEMGSEPNTALCAYDFTTNRWDILDVGGLVHGETMAEAGHGVGTFDWDPDLKQFLFYGASSGSNQPETPYHLWWFDPLGQSGRDKNTSPKPGYINVGYSTYDAVAKRWLFFGGGTFAYDPLANAFEDKQPAGTPPESLYFSAVAFDPDDRKSYVFGGQSTRFLNDISTYHLPTNTWSKRATPGLRPAPRFMTSLAFDSIHHVFMMFGGSDGDRVYSDTWIYDPAADAWTELHPPQVPTPVYSGLFEKLAFDAEHNVFILANVGHGGFASATDFAYGIQTCFFRYAGTGPDAGTASATYVPPSGSINRDATGWAKEPVLAASDGRLLAGWVECGRPWDTLLSAWFHVRVDERVGDGWAPLGVDFTAINAEQDGGTESHGPSLALIGGSPWVSWYDANNSGAEKCQVHAKRWNGSTWIGGTIGVVDNASDREPFVFQGRSCLADIGGIPHIGFLEIDKNYFRERVFAYVKRWNGSSWTLLGGALNRENGTVAARPNSTADSIAIAGDGATPYAAWTEYTADPGLWNESPPQVHVSRWNGSAWVAVGDTLNLDADGWAYDATIAILGGQPYVAWTERTQAGNARLVAKTFFDGTWSAVGAGAFNRDAAGWAYRPSLVADPATASLYLGWVEQAALGTRPQAHVSRLRGGAWSALGTTLNVQPTLGSAQRLVLAVDRGAPIAAWGEVSYGSMRQVFTKRWNGTAWERLDGTSDPPPPPPTTTGGSGTTGTTTTGSTGSSTTGGTTTTGGGSDGGADGGGGRRCGFGSAIGVALALILNALRTGLRRSRI